MTALRIGTRASALALAQTGQVASLLEQAGGRPVELVPVTTHGDVSRASLASLGGTGVFATALREALLAGRCDLVVHSMKDLPTAPHPGLVIAAVPERADPRDALCARDGLTLATLPGGARVGTGSPRRVAALRAARPDLEVLDLRGNVETRLRRVGQDLDAVVLAVAGLARLGREDAATEVFDLAGWPGAAGQGALAVEARTDHDLHDLLAAVHDPATASAVAAERAVLAALAAGCAAPVAVATLPAGAGLHPAGLRVVRAMVYGTPTLVEQAELPGTDEPAALGVGTLLGRRLLDRGAGRLTGATG